MKIIKEGKIPEKETPQYGIFYRGKCSKCGCEFEAYEDEFIVKEYIDSTVSQTTCTIGITFEEVKKEVILCPTCGKEIIIKQITK